MKEKSSGSAGKKFKRKKKDEVEEIDASKKILSKLLADCRF